jgi:Domain of Unknown Function (DUF1080)
LSLVKLRLVLFPVRRMAVPAFIVLCGWVAAAGGLSTPAASSSASPFLGKWDLTLHNSARDYASWLDLSEHDGQLQAVMVGRWGNARPLPRVAISRDRITFVSPKEEEGSQTDLVFQGTLAGNRLSGTLNGPDGKTWHWVGVRAPALERSGSPAWGTPIRLFNGRNLDGWRMSASGPRVWTVEDGNLVSPGHGPELITEASFGDFQFHVEFNAGPNANSGVYLRGRYEVQIETDSASEPPSHHTGGIYGCLAPQPELPRAPNTWQTFDITLIGRRVTVVQNRTTIIADQEIPGITGGALNSREGQPGPIYLQGSEEGHVLFRNIVITPAK